MEFYIGQIIMFGGNFAIRNFALADGQLLAISSNTALFSLYGTTYGGDGRTTFALPDLRGRVAIHAGSGPGLTRRDLGRKGGSETETLTAAQMPSHTHTPTANTKVELRVNTEAADLNEGGDHAIGSSVIFNNQPAEEALSASSVHSVVELNHTGGSQSHNNMQPWLAINYEVALTGIFPSRN